MAVLVTGGMGFLGRNLCRKLLETDDVFCLDNLASVDSAKLSGYVNDLQSYGLVHGHIFNFIYCDINNRLPELNDISVVYNLACVASPVKYKHIPMMILQSCTTGIFNLIEFANEHKAVLIHTSTSEVYGDPTVDEQDEEYNGNVSISGPRSCYDEGKRCAETILSNAYSSCLHVPLGIVRIFNTYGPGMELGDGRVVPEFVRRALKGEDLIVNGDGEQTRSYCYVDDTITALVNMAKHLLRYYEDDDHCVLYYGPVNIGNPNECITVTELAKRVIELTNSPSSIKYNLDAIDDPRKRKPKIDYAKSVLQWEPQTDLETGLLKTIEDIRERLNK